MEIFRVRKIAPKKKGWSTLNESVDGFWLCSRLNCIKNAKYTRSVSAGSLLLLTEFACGRHAIPMKGKKP